jgi:hypothetical protein
MKFLCRTVKPTESEWVVTRGDSALDASQEFHIREVLSRSQHRGLPCACVEHNCHYIVWFAEVEAEGHGTAFSRIFCYGTRPDHRIASDALPLEYVAEQLGWRRPAEELLLPSWPTCTVWEGAEVNYRLGPIPSRIRRHGPFAEDLELLRKLGGRTL